MFAMHNTSNHPNNKHNDNRYNLATMDNKEMVASLNQTKSTDHSAEPLSKKQRTNVNHLYALDGISMKDGESNLSRTALVDRTISHDPYC